MTRDQMLALLRKLEHCYPVITSEGLSPENCPRCDHDGSGHYDDCKLAAAISWLEDEENQEDTFESVGYEYAFRGKGHVLR